MLQAADRRHTAPPAHLEQQARSASRILERERLKLGLLHSKPPGTLVPGAPTDSRTPHHTDTPQASSPAHGASPASGKHADASEQAAAAEPATPEREEQNASAAAPACEGAAAGPHTTGPQQPQQQQQQQQQQQPVFMQGVAELRGLPTEGERRRSLAIRQKLLQDLDAQVPNLARCHLIEYFCSTLCKIQLMVLLTLPLRLHAVLQQIFRHA